VPILPPPRLVMASTDGRGGIPGLKSGQRVGAASPLRFRPFLCESDKLLSAIIVPLQAARAAVGKSSKRPIDSRGQAVANRLFLKF
jgi:hypothetical protein